MRKKEVDPLYPLIIGDEDPFIPSKGWAEMIKKYIAAEDRFEYI
jgi:hypothetical protein